MNGLLQLQGAYLEIKEGGGKFVRVCVPPFLLPSFFVELFENLGGSCNPPPPVNAPAPTIVKLADCKLY